MTLLRHDQQSPGTRQAVVLDFGDLAAEAERVREKARSDAMAIIERARKEAMTHARAATEQARQSGFQSGMEQGLAEGHERGYQEALAEKQAALADLSARWQAALDQIAIAHREMIDRGADQLLSFAAVVGERLVARVVETDSELAVEQARRALEFVHGEKAATLRVHPEDYPQVEEALPGLLANIGHNREVALVNDPTVDRGGCVVQTAHGVVDSRIDTQIRRLLEILVPFRRQDESAPSAEATQSDEGCDERN